eukprot:COSAG05_NODE_5085_length_1268_cov_0.873396_4_plen_42_part_01
MKYGCTVYMYSPALQALYLLYDTWIAMHDEIHRASIDCEIAK